MKYSQNNLLKININKHNPLIGGPLCPYNSIFCDNNKSDYYLFVSLAPPVGRKLTVETMFPEAPCHNSRSRFENSWCSTFLNLLFKQTLQICILPNDPLFHPSFWCTNDLALPNELRCIKPHIFGIFSKVWCWQSRLGCDVPCNLVFMRASRLTFSSRILQEVWVINSVNQRWLIHFSIHSAVRWHQQGRNWIWLSLFLQGGNLLSADRQTALNSNTLMIMKLKIRMRIWLTAQLKSHLLPHKSTRFELYCSSSA